MDQVINILFYLAIFGFMLGVLLNIDYVVHLPWAMPVGAKWPAIVWLVMLVGLGQWLGREANVSGITSVDGSAMVQVGSIIFAIAVLLIKFESSFDTRNFKLPFSLLMFYGVIGLLTAPLSEIVALASFKAISVSVAVALSVMAIKPLVKAKDPALLFNVTFAYFAFISFLAVVGGVLDPDVTRRLNKGVFGFMLVGWPALNSNSLSYVAAVVFVVALHRIFSSETIRLKLLYTGVCSVGMICLLLAQGRTSLVSSFLAVICMTFFIKSMRPFRFVLLLCIAAIIVVFSLTGSVGDWVDGLTEYMRRGVDDEQISTLSGRTGAWAESWDLFFESPIVGYGFYATGKILLAPHNSYFSVVLSSGLIGFIPWVIAIWAGLLISYQNLFLKRSLLIHERFKIVNMEMMAVIVVQFFRTITSQDLTIHSYSMLIFFTILVYIYATNDIRKNDSNDESEINDLVIDDVDKVKNSSRVLYGKKNRSVIGKKN